MPEREKITVWRVTFGKESVPVATREPDIERAVEFAKDIASQGDAWSRGKLAVSEVKMIAMAQLEVADGE